jgi:hypothetical protein
MPRLPSSLKWLIDRRGRIDGEIKKIEASLAECRRLAEDLDRLKDLLASVDQTLSLHDIRIDPIYIPTIRSHEVRVNLQYGELTRGILLFLRLNQGQAVTTSEITSFIALRYAELNTESISFAQLKSSVRYRLKSICRTGTIQRHHTHHTGRRDGEWSLADE